MITAKEIKKQQAKQLNKLLQHVGSQALLAHWLGVAPQVVSNWVSRGRISKSAAKEVENITKGIFRKEFLRPDVRSWIND